MSADEEKAIEFIQEIIDFLGDDDYQLYTTDRNILITLLNLIKKQQEEIEQLKAIEIKAKGGGIKVTLEGLIKLQEVIKKKDKITNEMAEQLESYKNEIDILSEGDIDCFIPREFCDIDGCVKKETCKQCIIDYFTNKVEGE